MVLRFLGIMLAVLVHSHAMATSASSASIQVVTGNLPPYAYVKDERLEGVATDIVREIMRRVGHEKPIRTEPWKRTVTKSVSGRLSFPFARIPPREGKYKWIGPILQDSFSFATLESDEATYLSSDDFKAKTIGVNRGAPTAGRLKKMGFENLNEARSESANVKMLQAKRIDGWYSTRLMIQSHMGKEGAPFKVAYDDLPIEMYVAASLDIPDSIVEKWQAALDMMKEDGTYEAILDRHSVRLP
ncbi:family 3 extracellular solute-binding protein [Vibrio nigripulchritudo ATCC 27043]|uniref:substrate-binding periplasmic protein n=1 Tax=Vibrio nigripulchritudo TaxID=28173 RepID=UPI00021C1861|nr:transporter substrate-binding domain-containing protein [Vibrio nigripulchritudo]EGU59372.1 family 3 extracellular solute-binding protein [Vibrio nigripulchritudo ATCC 27043]